MLETQETADHPAPPKPPGPARSHIDRRASRFVWALTIVFAVWMLLMLFSLHRRYGTQTFDMAIFDQGVWLLSRFEEPFVTIRGLNLFADHTSYILVLIAPLYWVAAGPQTLMVLSVAALAVGGPLTYAIARRSGLGNMLSVSLATAYLLHPAVGWNVWDIFHPEVLAVPLLLGAYLLALQERWRWMTVALVATLLVKEDAALAVVPLGIFLAFKFGRKKEGFGIAAFGSALLAFNMFVVLPAFSPTGALTNNWRYAQFGPGIGEAIKGMVTKPRLLFSELFGSERLTYYFQMLGPAPAALFAPEVLLVAVPITAANALSYHVHQYEIRFHYTVYALALVTIAAVSGVARLRRSFNASPAGLTAVIVAVAIAGNLMIGPWPHGREISPWAGSVHSGESRQALDEALAIIPPDAPVAADWFTVTHLANRVGAYMLPNPWHNRFYGAGEPYQPTGDDVDWLVAQGWAQGDDQIASIIRRLDADPDWERVVDNRWVLVMKRVSAPAA